MIRRATSRRGKTPAKRAQRGVTLLGIWALMGGGGASTLHAATAAEPVRDIATGSTSNLSSNPQGMISLGDRAIFWAAAPDLGYELYRTDGTPEGTVRIADLCPGRCDSYDLGNGVAAGGRGFFLANDGVRGRELWTSDGTQGGTRQLLDLAPGPEDGSYSWILAAGDRILFATLDDATERWNLWSSDGTVGGTAVFEQLALDGSGLSVPPGAPSPPPLPSDLRLIFENGTNVGTSELWEIDGTAAGSRRVLSLDVAAGKRICAADDDLPRVDSGGTVVAISDGGGCEPWWIADGVATRLADVFPGDSDSVPHDVVRFGSVAFFTAFNPSLGDELWRTDGTPKGTFVLRDLVPGSAGSGPDFIGRLGRYAFFAMGDLRRSPELWATTGEPGSLRRILDRRSGAVGRLRGSLPAGSVFFSTSAPGRRDALWTVKEDLSVVELADATFFGAFGAVGARAVFGADWGDGRGQELGASDGTPEGTGLLVDLVGRVAESSFPTQLTRTAGEVLFTASDGREVAIWRTDGTSGGTERVSGSTPPRFPSAPTLLLAPTATGAAVQAADGSIRHARAKTGGADFLFRPEGENPEVVASFSLGGRALFFLAEGDSARKLQLWSVDGRAAGTRRLAKIATFVPSISYSVRVAADLNGRGAYFLPLNALEEESDLLDGLWRTDGTSAGTRRVVDRPCAPCSDVVLGEAIVGPQGRFYYVVRDRFARFDQLWVSDGTTAGTRKILEIPGSLEGGGEVRSLARFGGALLFSAFDREHGQELWRTDGTAEGTLRLADIRSGPASSAPAEVTAVGSLAYFSADDEEAGRELWATDGTPRGTRRVADLRPGRRSSAPRFLTAIGARLVFAADDGRHGLEAWSSDGTKEGTALWSDIEPGRLPSSPEGFVALGSDLLFVAERRSTGRELFRLPLPPSAPR